MFTMTELYHLQDQGLILARDLLFPGWSSTDMTPDKQSSRFRWQDSLQLQHRLVIYKVHLHPGTLGMMIWLLSAWRFLLLQHMPHSSITTRQRCSDQRSGSRHCWPDRRRLQGISLHTGLQRSDVSPKDPRAGNRSLLCILWEFQGTVTVHFL